LTGTSVFLKRWTAGRHSLPSHGNSQWPRPADGRHWRRWRRLFHGRGSSSCRVVVRTSGSVRRAAGGQQPTAVGTNRTVAELWQIVGALGRCCLGHLRPSDDPSRSLTIRCSCRARLLGSDTEEVTWAAPEVPSSHRSAVRNRAVLRQPPLPHHTPPDRRPEPVSEINVAQPALPQGSATPPPSAAALVAVVPSRMPVRGASETARGR
jgi:hypothetical protein